MINNCLICKPVQNILRFLERNLFEVMEESIADDHFHELYFKLRGKATDIPIIDQITRHSTSKFTCKCYWNVIELEIVEEPNREKM